MEAIIKAWEEERKSSRLTSLPPEIEQQFQAERNKLKDQISVEVGSIERRMAEIALQRLDFCLQDIFQLRKDKLLLATTRGEEIDADNLLPWEQQYYAEIRRIEYFYKQNVTTPTSMISTQPVAAQGKDESKVSLPNAQAIPLAPQKTAEWQNGEENPEIPKAETQAAGNYITIRFLQAEGAIIGVDMREYGPFEAGEIVYLPEVHARIFITNGVARQVFPSA